MKILPCRQHSPEWLEARAGLPTASELDALITPLFKEREGDHPITYLAKKLAEKWTGEPLIEFEGSWATDQGNIIEEEAVPWYEFTQEVEVKTGVFLTTDDGKFGCSPDGIVTGKDGVKYGLEVKSLQPKAHFAVLIRQQIPKDYIVQVHSSIWATGFPYWDFLAYRRNCPCFVQRIHREEKICEAIEAVVDKFDFKLRDNFETLKSEYFSTPMEKAA